MTKRIKILGRAGCGKTTELKKRYKAYLSSGYNVNDIAVMTFRKAAADDVFKAVYRESPFTDAKELRKNVGTIHSICNRLLGTPDLMNVKDYKAFLDKYPYYSYFVKEELRDTDTEFDFEKCSLDHSQDIFDLYNWCRNTMTSPQDCWQYPAIDKVGMPIEKISEFFEDYDKYKLDNEKVDFSDMLQKVLINRIMVGTKIIIVDECQDLTPQMYAIFKMWEKEADEVIIAGDPHQSIYGVFGASPDFYNNFEADEEVNLPHSHRLTHHINNFADKILRYDNMYPEPVIPTKYGYGECVFHMYYTDEYPAYASELHLVRANYQIHGIALKLAKDGKLFSTNNAKHEGWTTAEVELANAIISIRTGRELTDTQIEAIANYFPVDILGINCGDMTPEMCKILGISYKRALSKVKRDFIEGGCYNTVVGIDGVCRIEKWKPNQRIIDILKSEEPTQEMTKSSVMFKAKMNGIKDRAELIDYAEAENRQIMTIHGSKGLEAYTVFLHTAITTKIKKAIIKDIKESQAETRVWYVGATRAMRYLYLVQDKGSNYQYPTIPPAPVEVDISGVDVWADDAVDESLYHNYKSYAFLEVI